MEESVELRLFPSRDLDLCKHKTVLPCLSSRHVLDIHRYLSVHVSHHKSTTQFSLLITELVDTQSTNRNMFLDFYTVCQRTSAYSVPKTCPGGVVYLPGGLHRCRGPTDGLKKQWL
jgi:hypothetical protein